LYDDFVRVLVGDRRQLQDQRWNDLPQRVLLQVRGHGHWDHWKHHWDGTDCFNEKQQQQQ
jgi:hypothetical protein